MAQLSELLDFAGFGLVCRDYVTLCLAVLETQSVRQTGLELIEILPPED